jgi:hypothetical protein
MEIAGFYICSLPRVKTSDVEFEAPTCTQPSPPGLSGITTTAAAMGGAWTNKAWANLLWLRR